MERSTISRNQLVQNILKIGHGDLDGYTQLGFKAAKEEPELFAHLIAWNFKKGEVRDSKVALPVIALRGDPDEELFENAVAHLVSLDPRNLVRAIEFSRKWRVPVTPGAGNMLEKAVTGYLRLREENPGWLTKSMVQHRASMKALYALYHVKPNGFAQAVLFKRQRPKGSVFEALAQLKNMAPQEAAGTILNHKIPFLIASRAVGGIKNKPDVVMALIDQASGAELITNTKMFQSLGVFDNPVLRAAFDAAVERTKKDKKVSSLKAGKAVAAMEKVGDKKAAAAMKNVQESKLAQLGGIEGDWLVLGDRSGSMHSSLEIAKRVSSLIAQQVKGTVNLVFFNTMPTDYDVTGKSLDEVKAMTARIKTGGGTSIGCGLDLMADRNIVVNGVVICSDGGDNSPPLFHHAYKKYADKMGVEPTVYLLWVPGDHDMLTPNCEKHGIAIEKFDVSKMDYYALPNLVKTLRTSRYSLIDEIMAAPLLKLSDVFARKEAA